MQSKRSLHLPVGSPFSAQRWGLTTFNKSATADICYEVWSQSRSHLGQMRSKCFVSYLVSTPWLSGQRAIGGIFIFHSKCIMIKAWGGCSRRCIMHDKRPEPQIIELEMSPRVFPLPAAAKSGITKQPITDSSWHDNSLVRSKAKGQIPFWIDNQVCKINIHKYNDEERHPECVIV